MTVPVAEPAAAPTAAPQQALPDNEAGKKCKNGKCANRGNCHHGAACTHHKRGDASAERKEQREKWQETSSAVRHCWRQERAAAREHWAQQMRERMEARKSKREAGAGPVKAPEG